MTAGSLRRTTLGWTVLALALLLQACAGQSQSEADLYVTKTDDTFDGACLPRDCSLREAVAAANAAPGPNTIHVPAGDFRLSLAGSSEDEAASGDLDLTETTTILGAGFEGDEATFITAGAGLGDRLFHLLDGVTTLEALYVGGGAAEAGGAVLVESEAGLTLRQSRLDASRATGADGGGLVYSLGTLDIVESRLTNGCSAGPGGAIVSTGSASVTGSQFEDNESVTSGGSIANHGQMTLSATTINRGFAGGGELCGTQGQGDGGGIFNEGDLTVTDGEITRTEATGVGGAIATSGSLQVQGTVIRSLATRSGGGVAVAPGGTATITAVDINSSASDGNGGGVFVEAGGTASVNDSVVAGNAPLGGGLANNGDLTVRGSTVTYSRAFDGAGIHNSGTLIMEASTIRQNSARDHGGGIFSLGTMTISSSTISGNTAVFGGGLFLQGDVTLTNCTISTNNATASGGGVSWGSGTLSLTHCTLARNAAPEASGLLANTSVVVSNTVIGENTLGANCQLLQEPIAIGNLDQDGSCGFSATENVVGLDPGLGPLQDNGGPTETHRLSVDSPARNAAASAACLPADQRTVVRPQDGQCDIGAVEMETGT
jgi:CSLREA domain-containing protein